MDLKEITALFTSRLHLPLKEAAFLAAGVRLKSFKKNEWVFRQGEMGDFIYLVLNGLCYVSYIHPDGHEKVKRFVSRGDSLAPFVSQLTKEPSNYGAKTLLPTTCVQFKYEDYMKLVEKSWSVERSLRKELELQIIEREKKEYELFLMSAEERYASFIKRHEKILEHIPQKLIASYINVDPATLSRIRGRH